MLDRLQKLSKQFEAELGEAASQADILAVKAKYIGKKGEISSILKGMKDASPEEKKTVGKESNRLKQEMHKAISQALSEREKQEIEEQLRQNRQDISLTKSLLGQRHPAAYHPVTIVQREIEDIFTSMGFTILNGPHIEDDYHNFEALNIPETHPARDMQDTFWFSDMKHLLRTHTSPMQVRGMETHTAPFKFVCPGKVFRCEDTDASHEMVFHQLEGMMVGENISVANLIYFMKVLLAEIFGKEVEVRLRPGYFPFVEPGFELDIKCLICGGSGCSVCKQTGWVELLPCGMVHPRVLEYGQVDTDKYNGFAFGLGLDRLVMMRYGIDDIRYLHSGDLRFGQQFSEY
ncbi:phenylalanine--tRNA ligase subunit alpha [Chitinivibrio alkaliphilus]|uniref:Phenylalanine--tRNA ligase alpha subunit n=1 Tax=Chitinivibrio alkaliphilus ACht1 TaxID=1313304 RepID=U7DAN9_9BACT|nr:phenylalanine--tRNA ligase subunit alpha [Chitinivibrio alkaliphilus]ERP39097.1 phenylalanyl-tRNA synthetase alpha chain [Chitinivibrio alkaliphilus ACht1]